MEYMDTPSMEFEVAEDYISLKEENDGLVFLHFAQRDVNWLSCFMLATAL